MSIEEQNLNAVEDCGNNDLQVIGNAFQGIFDELLSRHCENKTAINALNLNVQADLADLEFRVNQSLADAVGSAEFITQVTQLRSILDSLSVDADNNGILDILQPTLAKVNALEVSVTALAARQDALEASFNQQRTINEANFVDVRSSIQSVSTQVNNVTTTANNAASSAQQANNRVGNVEVSVSEINTRLNNLPTSEIVQQLKAQAKCETRKEVMGDLAAMLQSSLTYVRNFDCAPAVPAEPSL
jgi:methyl-accepting chemotaxis protein